MVPWPENFVPQPAATNWLLVLPATPTALPKFRDGVALRVAADAGCAERRGDGVALGIAAHGRETIDGDQRVALGVARSARRRWPEEGHRQCWVTRGVAALGGRGPAADIK